MCVVVDVVGRVAMFANPPRGSDGFSGVLFEPRALFGVMCPRPTQSAVDLPSSGGHRLGAGRTGVGGAGPGLVPMSPERSRRSKGMNAGDRSLPFNEKKQCCALGVLGVCVV